MNSYRSCLPLLVLAVTLGLMGCDSGVAPTSETGTATTTVQFAASGNAVTENDSTTTIDLTISNPDGNGVNVDVIFAAPASDATADDFAVQGAELTPIEGSEALFVATVSFPAGAQDGDAQSIAITDLSDEDATEARESAVFALQNVQTSGSARIGSPSSFDLSIGFPTIREARETPLGNNITVQGTVIRIDGSVTFLQDESGGIATFDDAFAEGVSIGDRVVVGGEMDVFAGLLQIADIGADGFTVLSSDNEVEATTATLAELAENGESFESTLVRVEGMSFDDSGTFQGSTNYTLSDGSGGAVQLRVTSNSFYAGQPIPGGEVTFEGVLSQFNGNFGGIEPNTGYQLLALNEGDLTGGDDTGGGPQPVSINEARQSLDQEVVIEGTVTRAFGAYARVQDDSGPTGASALVIRQTSGDESEAFQGDIAGGTIQPGTTLQLTGTVTEFNGVVQINGGDLAGYQVLSQGNAPGPQSVTLADLESNGEDYESELVEVSDLTFTEASGAFENGTNYDVSDGTATLTLRVQNDNESALAGESIPGAAFTYTGVTGEFNGSYQLIPVRPSDIGTSGGAEVSTINEARQTIGSTVTIEGTISRAFGDFTRIQDASGPTGASALVIRQTGGAFFDDVQSGEIAAGTTLRLTGTTSEFNGVAQINEDDLASYEVLSQGEAPAPQSVTLADFDSNGEDYESELVEITDLTFSEASGTFENSTNYDVSDGTATLTLRVQNDNESDLGGVAIPKTPSPTPASQASLTAATSSSRSARATSAPRMTGAAERR